MLLILLELLREFLNFVEHVLLNVLLGLNLGVELLKTDLLDVIGEVAVQKEGLFEVRPLLDPLNVLIFLVVDLASYFFYVEEETVSLNILIELRMVLSHLAPLLLPYEEAIRVARALINDLRSPIKGALKPPNLVISLKPDLILYLFVDFIPNIKSPLDSKDHHIDIFQLCKNNLVLIELDRL